MHREVLYIQPVRIKCFKIYSKSATKSFNDKKPHIRILSHSDKNILDLTGMY